jgi:hypothetical protein
VVPVTVGEIARRIQRPGEDVKVAIARLANWTKESLLRPIKKHTGTGRDRFYPDMALVDAAVLDALTGVLGIPAVKVGQMGLIAPGAEKTLFQLARLAYEKFPEHEQAGEWLWLGVHRDRDRPELGTTAILYITKDIYADGPVDGPAGKPRRLQRSFEAIDIPNWSETSAVVNLTKLFRRLQTPTGG